MNNKKVRSIGFGLFIVGTILLAFIGAVSVWGDLEATVFNAAITRRDRLTTLKCPAVITTNETGIVTASFYNPDDKSLDMETRTYVTDGYVVLMREIITKFTLAPGETSSVEVQVTADNAAYDRLILVRMHQQRRNPLPHRTASCGIMVVDIPFLTGTQFIILVVSVGILLSSGGLAFWALNTKPIVWERKKIFKTMIVFAAAALLMAALGLMGQWFVAIFIGIVWVLMGVEMIVRFSNQSKIMSRAHQKQSDLNG